MGIVVERAPSIVRGDERVGHDTIPGRSGELTITEGEGVFNSYIQTVSIHAHSGVMMGKIFAWLTGDGFVTFSPEPERKQRARVIGAITATRHSPRMDWWHAEVQFYCFPLKSELYETPVTVTASGTSVYNPGDVPARPKMTVTCAAGANSTIKIGDQTFNVNLTGTTLTGFIVDSDAQIVTSKDGATNLTSKATGEFPVLAKGANAITLTNVSSVVFERRVMYL